MTKISNSDQVTFMSQRFRGFLPVVVDVETAGFDPKKNALLEVAAITLDFDEEGFLFIKDSYHAHVAPFAGSELDPKALEFTGIKPHNPFRLAKSEADALNTIFKSLHQEIKLQDCQRAVLVGHNPAFDLSFLQAAMRRCNIDNSPFHAFTTFDTATLAAVAYGQTVLLRAAQAAGIDFDSNEAHSAIYDARKTAELFCKIINTWQNK